MPDRSFSIKDWPVDDRPREKLFKNGEHTLSDAELLAVLIRTGSKGKSALDLSREILQKFVTFRSLSRASFSDWRKFKGLGKVKVAQIKAALEISRRFQEDRLKEGPLCINSSQDVATLLMPRMRDLKKEVVKAVLLNSQNRIIEIVEVEEGTVNYCQPIIREIFEKAIMHGAAALICAHNHPSGEARPSPEDRIFTRKLHDAGQVLQICVVDHIIIANDAYYSFADEGGLK